MRENILLISEKNDDLKLFSQILDPDLFSITLTSFDKKIENKILTNGTSLILADYDLISDKADLFFDLQQNRSKACLVFYGNEITSEEMHQILQRGVYSFIPRPLLKERLNDIVIGGLENRKAFIEILGMMDQLKGLNEKLENEKENLKKRNQELNFINLLSSEISYDLNWDNILSRMIYAGLEETMGYILFGMIYRIGNNWTLSAHMKYIDPDKKRHSESIISYILEYLNSNYGVELKREDIEISLIPMETDRTGSEEPDLSNINILPLSLAGKISGYVFSIFPEPLKTGDEKDILMNTLTNILALSLKNAQEYYRLREAAVTDNLTGIYNRKGLFDFMGKELSRAKRYKKPLSFVISDMDDFKSINDTMGHQAGDYVLRELAELLKNSIRQPDIVSRYGGDEFAFLLPETDRKDAEAIMERILRNIEEHTFEWGPYKIKTKMSYGISDSNEIDKKGTEDNLIRLADSRLYEKKPADMNRK